MEYNDCEKIVKATEHLFVGTQYSIEYYLDAEPYFTFKGEIIDAEDVPEHIKNPFWEILETLEIEF